MKVTTPVALEAPEAADTVSLTPRLEVRVTVFPEIGFDCASRRVMVIAAVEVPFAVSELAVEMTVETVGLIAPVVNATVGVVESTTLSVVSVAV